MLDWLFSQIDRPQDQVEVMDEQRMEVGQESRMGSDV